MDNKDLYKMWNDAVDEAPNAKTYSELIESVVPIFAKKLISNYSQTPQKEEK